MFLKPNERPINNHLDSIIDRWADLPAPDCLSSYLELEALARAERCALHYMNEFLPKEAT